jgi:hypothetical protein
LALADAAPDGVRPNQECFGAPWYVCQHGRNWAYHGSIYAQPYHAQAYAPHGAPAYASAGVYYGASPYYHPYRRGPGLWFGLGF